MWKRKSGFSLIELLLVIAVIAILAALFLPALSRSKEQTYGVVCLNNLKQLQLAWHMYVEDHSGRFPRNNAIFQTPTNELSELWVQGYMTIETESWAAPHTDNTNVLKMLDKQFCSLGSYAGSAGIYQCPGDKSWAIINGQRHSRVRSYSMNAYLGSKLKFLDDWRVRRQNSELKNPSPSDTFVFICEHPDSIDDGHFITDMSGREAWTSLPASHHGRSGILSFADGHVEKHRWLDSRTLRSYRRERALVGGVPGSKDVLWIRERTAPLTPSN